MRFIEWDMMALSSHPITSDRIRSRAPIALLAWCTVAGLTMASGSIYADAPLKDVPALAPSPEKKHLDKLDAALAPLLSIAPSAEDAEHLRDAVSAVRSNNMDSFAGAKAQISDPIARKLADWIRLRNGMGDAAEYKAFLRDNPLWPARCY